MELYSHISCLCLVIILLTNDAPGLILAPSKSADKAVFGNNVYTLTCAYTLDGGDILYNIQLKRQREGEVDSQLIIFFNQNQNASYVDIGDNGDLELRTTATSLGSGSGSIQVQFSSIKCVDKATYTWVASYADNSGPQTMNSNINVPVTAISTFEQLISPVFSPSSSLKEGDNVTFTCSGDVGGDPQAVYRWEYYLGGSTIGTDISSQANSEAATYNDTSCSYNQASSVVLQMRYEFNGIVVRCSVDQGLGGVPKYRQTDALSIQSATTTTVMNPKTTSPISTSTCDDIDSSACHLMAINKPDLCMDAGVANGACKRFCKLCPLTCYNCTGVRDYHDCKTTVECKQGEVCMMKQLRSYIDGHLEYEMTCEPKQRCDGDLALAFGRRDVSGRDLSISCCADDLCNYPDKTRTETTTDKPYTTTLASSVCKKDIIFMVGSSVEIRGDEKNIKIFIEDIVKNLDIGRDASLVSMAKINGDVNKVWDLDSYFTKPALISAIENSLHLSGYRTPDIDAAIQFVKSYAATPRAGDRPDVDDVVVLITGSTFHTSSKTDSLASQLRSISNDVIRIGIGRRDRVTHIATDAKHDFHVQTGADLAQMTQRVVDLICQ